MSAGSWRRRPDGPSCEVCGRACADIDTLAAHLVEEANRSDVRHVMWLNRTVTKHRVDAPRLATLLRELGGGVPAGEGRVKR